MAALMLVGCTSKEELLQQRVQNMAASAELGTVEYTVKKIVKCDDKQTFAIGDRKILDLYAKFFSKAPPTSRPVLTWLDLLPTTCRSTARASPS